MTVKYHDFWLWACFVLLLVVGLAASIYSAINPAFSAVTVLSGYATFAIALLTVVYVVTTRHQLRIMARQLGEMTRTRELQAQPLPWPISIRVYSERPRLFYDENRNPRALIRHIVETQIRNLGTSPAVSVDISCRLHVPAESKPIEWSAVAIRAEVIEEKQEFPKDKGEKDSFLYPQDADGRLLASILENKIDKLPQLHIYVFYRNTLGGCFRLRRAYKLYPRNGSREALKGWLERIHNFPLRYKEDLDSLSQLERRMDQRADKLFAELKEKCVEGLSEEAIDYDVEAVPASGEVTPLTSDQYAEAIGGLSYGFRIDSSYLCPASEMKKKENANDAMQRIAEKAGSR